VAEFYRVVRVRPNGREDVLRDIPIASLTTSQVERAETFADAETRKASGLHIRVYSSSGEVVGPGDLIWDSDIEYA
jgi:hypothetical protein